jgi:hypothetical protein
MLDAAQMHPNLRLKGTTFHFRRRIPKKIYPRLLGREVVCTLRTRGPRQAAVRARVLFVASEQVFDIVNTRPTLPPDQAYALVTKWLRDTLNALETGRALGLDYFDPECSASTTRNSRP